MIVGDHDHDDVGLGRCVRGGCGAPRASCDDHVPGFGPEVEDRERYAALREAVRDQSPDVPESYDRSAGHVVI